MHLIIELTAKERAALEATLTHHQDSRPYQRALALLLLDDGVPVEEVAEQLYVSRQTLYNWIDRFEQREAWPVEQRLLDATRSGRPPTAQGIIDPWIEKVWETDPRTYGYGATGWTAALLRRYLGEVHHHWVGVRSIGLALARLRVRWKLPRYELARRAPFWRQSKGGLNTASGAIRTRWC